MNTGTGVPPRPGGKVVYSLHGGDFIRLSSSPRDMAANIGRGSLEHGDNIYRIFVLEYRLSMYVPDKPAHPFPAAPLDALAGYAYLTKTVGFSPENIIIEGASAGGGES
jgi:acetyl esterase/lipase